LPNTAAADKTHNWIRWRQRRPGDVSGTMLGVMPSD
jgi:hypothetical protein